MFLIAIVFTFILQGGYVKGLDLNSVFPRLACYENTQDNCNVDFTDAYPHLSLSVTNLTKADTYMLLITRRNKNNPELLHKCAGRLPPNTTFDPKEEVIVIIMPFIASYCTVAIYREWTEQLLIKGNYNIIIIDYGWGNQLDYATAVWNARDIVRYQVIILINNIKNQTGMTYHKFTFIGHSLGAHLAGMVSASTGAKKIFGIDPAGPGFESPLNDRLDRSDADYVEVWHCDAGKCLPFFGTDYNGGHINVVFNGGTFQTSCYPVAFHSILKRDWIYGFGTLLIPTTCFHAQCAQYFKVSINPGNCQFVGIECESYEAFKQGKCKSCGPNGEKCIIVGFDTEKHSKVPPSNKTYYVETAFHCPYCDNSHLDLDGFSATYEASLELSRK